MHPSPIARRAVFAIAAACAIGRAARAQAPREVRVTVSSTSFVLGGVLLGQQAGLFVKRGMQPKFIVMDSGSAAMAALISHSAEFAVAGPGEVLAARARGLDVVVVASLYRGFAGSIVLGKAVAAKLGARPDAPLANRLKALDGLALAVPSATSALLAPVRTAVEATGGKARFTYMAQPAMPAALATGAIDGMVASFPFAGTPILNGSGVLWIDGPRGELPPASLPASSSTLHATGEYIAANQETVRLFQTVLVDIADFIRADPAAAKAALARAYPALGADEITLAFDSQKDNWTQPFLSVADMQHELELLRGSVDLPALATLDPGKVVIPRI